MAESPLDPGLQAWLAARTQAVLVTLRGDGSPQSSNVAYAWDDGVARVSVTDGRAKTANLRRDPRGMLHVLGADFWSYAAVAVRAELSPVTTEPGDETGRALLAYYERAAGKAHPDPEDYFAAMVAERRLLLTLHPLSATGWNAPAGQ